MKREPFWGPGNPHRIRWLTPAEHTTAHFRRKNMNADLPYFIGIAFICIMGVFLLFH
jgi:hypothetical protein